MSDVSIFTLDGTTVNVKDSIARTTANSASAQASANAQDIANLKALSRLTIAYDSNTETIAFSTTQHT